MDTFAEIADERRRLADQLGDLSEEQRATPSLCREWSVQEVVAHLVVPLEVSSPRIFLAILASRGRFARANVQMARQQAQRPYADLIDTLHRLADKRFTPPGAGPEAPLTDVLVHGLDICWPLGLVHPVPAERTKKSLTYLATAPGGLVPKGALHGLRFQAEDLDWAHGEGPLVSGQAEAVLLVMTGRAAALEHLHGDGVAALAGRLA